MKTLSKRQILLLKKVVEYIEETQGYFLDTQIKGYDEQEFDAGCLADDLKIEFQELED
jgi:hypothetical protein